MIFRLYIIPLALLLIGCENSLIELTAKDDFTILQIEGIAPYYRNVRSGLNVLQVDADKTGYQFGGAQTPFGYDTAFYDITIYTVGDQDGVCEYKLAVNSFELHPIYTQQIASEGEVMVFTWNNVLIKNGDLIQVMSNGSDSSLHPGGKGPNGYHMAHGRWYKIELKKLNQK